VKVDLIVDAAQHTAHVFMAGMIEDQEVDRHADAAESTAGHGPLRVGVEVVDDDGKVEVTMGAEVAAGAGAEGDDADGIRGFDDALNGGEDFLLGDADVELDG
jgi:hypothetical protein